MLTGFLVPLPAIIVIFTSKDYDFVPLAFPPTFCSTWNANISYYSIGLVNNVILMIGVPMLTYLLWVLHKVCQSLLLLKYFSLEWCELSKVWAFTFVLLHTDTHRHTYINTQTHKHIHKDTHTQRHAHICTHIHIQKYTHACTYTQWQTHRSIGIYMYTLLLLLWIWVGLCGNKSWQYWNQAYSLWVSKMDSYT